MKAFLITRVSTEQQHDEVNILPIETARLENYCHYKGFTIANIFNFDENTYEASWAELDQLIYTIIKSKEKVAICCDRAEKILRNIFDKRISLLHEKALRDELELHFISDGQIINGKISAVEKSHLDISLVLAKCYTDRCP